MTRVVAQGQPCVLHRLPERRFDAFVSGLHSDVDLRANACPGAVAVRDGKIAAIVMLTDPERLRKLDLSVLN